MGCEGSVNSLQGVRRTSHEVCKELVVLKIVSIVVVVPSLSNPNVFLLYIIVNIIKINKYH